MRLKTVAITAAALIGLYSTIYTAVVVLGRIQDPKRLKTWIQG